MTVEDRLAARGWSLTPVVSPLGSYAPAVASGNQVFVSGHTARRADRPGPLGAVGVEVALEEAVEAARVAALNVLSAARSVVSLDDISHPVFLRGYVRSNSFFTRHPEVLQGASEVLGVAFDPPHARAALGVSSLPGGACVEVECVFQLR